MLGWWGRLLPLLLCVGVAAELLAIPRSDWMARLIGSNAVNWHDADLRCSPVAR